MTMFVKQRSISCVIVFSLLLSLSVIGCGGHDDVGQLPVISSVTTEKGTAEAPVTGGTAVTIRGLHFSDDAKVTFGGQESAKVDVPNSTTIIATTGAVFRSGIVPITVTTGGQIVKKPSAFNYTPLTAFFSDRDGDFEVFTMETDGAGVRQITKNTLRDPLDPTTLITDESPRFSPDGRNIIFDSNRTGDFEIFIMGRAGTDPTNITNDLAIDQTPAFSPDGGQVVFISNRLNGFQNPEGDFEVFLMDQDGSNLQQLTQNTKSDRDPVFSPDGGQILFVSDRDGDEEIFLMDRNGNNPQQLTLNTTSDRHPVFSPDGSQILFVSDRDGDEEIFLMDRNGNNPQQLTLNTASDREPVFSPDGREILFTSNRTGNLEVFLMKCDDGGIDFATCNLTDVNLTLHVATDSAPSLSP